MRSTYRLIATVLIAGLVGCGDSGKPVPPGPESTGTKDAAPPAKDAGATAGPAATGPIDLDKLAAAMGHKATLTKIEFKLGDKEMRDTPIATMMVPAGVTAYNERNGHVLITDGKDFTFQILTSDKFYGNLRARAKFDRLELVEAADAAVHKDPYGIKKLHYKLMARIPLGPADCTVYTPAFNAGEPSLEDAALMLHCARTLALKNPLSDEPLTALTQLGWIVIDRSPAAHYVNRASGIASNRTMALVAKATTIEELRLTGFVNDEGMAPLAAMTQLKKLTIDGVTGASLKHISGMTKLSWLELELATIADADLAAIAGLAELRTLRLAPQFPDGADKRGQIGAGISQLNGLKKLEALNLGVHASDEALAQLDLPALNDLVIDHSAVTGKTLAKAKLPMLTTLSARETQISDLSGLAALPVLRRIDVLSNRVPDDQLAHIANHPALKEVSLDGPHITDKGITLLGQSKMLESLRLHKTKITDAGVAELCKIPTLKYLDISEAPGVTDAAFDHLRKAKQIESVVILDAGITEAGEAQFRKDRSEAGE